MVTAYKYSLKRLAVIGFLLWNILKFLNPPYNDYTYCRITYLLPLQIYLYITDTYNSKLACYWFCCFLPFGVIEAGRQPTNFSQSTRQPLSAGAMLKAPSMVIWGHRKAHIQMIQDPEKIPGSKRGETLGRSRMKEKWGWRMRSRMKKNCHLRLRILIVMLQQHSNVWGRVPKRAANLSQQSIIKVLANQINHKKKLNSYFIEVTSIEAKI